jgi:hypothetical protein
MNSEYIKFLHSKIEVAKETGFVVPRTAVNPSCKPHQIDAILWALKGGNRALFGDGVGYLKAADEEIGMPTLFDFISSEINA